MGKLYVLEGPKSLEPRARLWQDSAPTGECHCRAQFLCSGVWNMGSLCSVCGGIALAG